MRLHIRSQLSQSLWAALTLFVMPLAQGASRVKDSQPKHLTAMSVERSTRSLNTEKIIGKNDLIPVLNYGSNIPAKYAPIIDAIGKMSMGCTATHIGQGLVLSAGHCFRAPKQRTPLPCDGITVEWGLRQDAPPYLTSKCTEVVAARASYEEDYSIFRVEPIPSAYVDFDFDERPAVGSSITQFGHPRARPLEWSQLCALQTSAKGGWGSKQFSHDCDSEPCSSGAALIDDTSLKIVGIHDGGLDDWNYGTFIKDTPLREFIGRGGATPEPIPAPGKQIGFPEQRFGPFPNNGSFVLTDFGTSLGSTISFDLLIDLEEGRDFLLIEYGHDQTMELTGFQNRYLRNLELPLKVSFRSNRFIRSTLALFENIIISE